MDVAVPDDDAADHTRSFGIPGEGARLRPNTRYRYRITGADDDRLVGEGRFETAPADPEHAAAAFSFGIMSCNQPFDAKGFVRDDARRMLRAARRALEQHDCKFIIMMGDQMYADMPTAMSLFDSDYFAHVAPPGRETIHDCTTAEVRRLYQQRYRHFGGVRQLRELLAAFPTYTIIDDHDIVDNWGSHPDHRSPKWRSVGEGARWAYFDYQAAHLMPRSGDLPPSFHYDFDYGPVSFFVMDLRSQRWVDDGEGELYATAQADDLKAFLERTRRQKVVFFVLSVPPVHLPRYLAVTAAHLTPEGEDFSDRWSSLGHVDDRDRFMKLIRSHQRAHPNQRHVFLAGDIHVGCAQELIWEDGERLYQFISSGLTNRAGRLMQRGAELLMRFDRTFDVRGGGLRSDVKLLGGVDSRTKNPYGRLNVGVVRVSADAPKAGLEFFLYGHDGDEPVCVYRTPRL